MNHTSLLRTAAAAITTLAITTGAHALTCFERQTDVLAPADGAEGVPIDAMIWVGGHYTNGWTDPVLTVLDQAGDEVEVEHRYIESVWDWVTVLVPLELLAPFETYEVWFEGERVTTFDTADQVDLEAPEPPQYAALADGETQLVQPLSTEIRSIEVDMPGEGLFVLIDLESQAALDADRMEGEVADIAEDPNEVLIGGGTCDGSWHGMNTSDAVEFRFATVDLSGNFSGWSEPLAVQPEEIGGCNCRQATGSAAPLSTAAALALAGLFLVHRRRP